MKRIGVIANCGKPDAGAVLRRLEAKSRELGMRLVTCDATAGLLETSEPVAPDRFEASIDVLVALGGDGTVLAAVRQLREAAVPVLGVNLGSLGFLTSVPEDQVEDALTALGRGTCISSQRTMAVCEVSRNGGSLLQTRCLNDIVVGWGESSRVVALSVLINDAKVTTYECDGLIVSTPTGSTGHQLSAGGPIVHPETPAFAINVICPHTLGARPLVVPDDRRIAVEVEYCAKRLILSIDGQEIEHVQQGDRITVVRHPARVRFLHLPGYDYFSVLRHKLGWRGSVRKTAS